jgi:hypothetical protein
VQAINLYLTAPGGAAGTETLYATGITTTTFACSYAAPADQPTAALPAVNTTGWPSAANVLATQALTEVILENQVEKLSALLSGVPIQRRVIFHESIRSLGVFAAWRQVFSEVCTLIWANWPAATAGYMTTAVGQPQYKWTLP